MNPRALWLAFLLLPSQLAVSSVTPARDRRLRLYQIHTGESLHVVYRREGAYSPRAVAKLDRFLRDYRTGTVKRLDPRLFDLLADVALAVGRPDGEIDVVCGYRTRRTNELLRSRRSGVAEHSLHMKGEALDIRMPGVRVARLREAALRLKRGGVGYYPSSGFIHVDVGRVRRW